MLLRYIVKDDKYTNINQVLSHEFQISSRLLHKLIINKHIFLNNNCVDTRTLIEKDDIIIVNLDFDEKSENIIPSNLPLNIIYEDDCLLILDKLSGIAIHPSILHYDDTLSNGVRFYFDQIGLLRKIRPVNRLDFNTSGLVIFAKNEYTQEHLIKQMNNNKFYKEYLAIVEGHFDEKKGIINLPIARKDNSIIERCISSNGQDAITEYEILNEYENMSLVRCILKTGRTHQIRVHMSAINHPIVGDTLYGHSNSRIKRQALHSHRIIFTNPLNNELLDLKSDLPFDMKNLII